MHQKPDYRHERLTDRLHDAGTDRLKDMGEKANQVASDVTEQARYYGQQAQDAARQFKPVLEKSLKEQPMTTLAGVALIGFLLGALWKK